MTVAATGVVLSEIDEDVNSRGESLLNDVGNLLEIATSRLARVGTGSETVFHHPVRTSRRSHHPSRRQIERFTHDGPYRSGRLGFHCPTPFPYW